MAIFGYNDFSMCRLQRVGDGLANGWFVVNRENMEFLLMRELAHYASRFLPNADGF